jgi:hypothetical protein
MCPANEVSEVEPEVRHFVLVPAVAMDELYVKVADQGTNPPADP